MPNVPLPTFSIYTKRDPEAGGTTTGDGAYPMGSTCVLNATPKTGYGFLGWKEITPTMIYNTAYLSKQTQYSFTVQKNAGYMAFLGILRTVTTSSNPAQGGTTSGGGQFVCEHTLLPLPSGGWRYACTVEAVPAAGYVFVDWKENNATVSTSARYNFESGNNRTLVAGFKKVCQISLTVVPPEGGTVQGGGAYDPGAACTIQCSPNARFVFMHWLENNAIVSRDAQYAFPVSGDRSIKAVMGHEVRLSEWPNGMGYVAGGGIYAHGAQCVALAVAKPGRKFVGWFENQQLVTNDPAYVFAVEDQRNLVARFPAG